MRVAIIGAGMAGVLSGIKLAEAGIHDFTIYEKADRLGGTWRENTYPGIGCDVPSHLYSYSFALNPDWSHRFSPGDEIQAYFERIARDYDLEPHLRFGDEVVRCSYRDGKWELETASGHRDSVDVVIAATGVLHHPNVPHLEGIESFAGASFHSARWDHRVPIDGRRVGVIGTGSSAVQITGAVTERVAKYVLFQRTAQWIMPQENPEYSPEERESFRCEPQLLETVHSDLAKLFAEGFASGLVDANSPAMQAIAEGCLRNLEDNVADPVLRERLRPNYRAVCKRLVISPNFYDAIQRPNAELVTEAIERIEPAGVRTLDGRLHELDVLVLATGFKVDRFLRPIEVVGRDGVRLDDVWEKRPLAYLSISIPGFPNLFLLNGPNGPVGNFSLIQVAELQFAYIFQLIELLRSGRARAVCASQTATQDLEAERVEAARNTIWSSGCQSWYLDDRGIPMTWPWTFERFRAEMARPRLEAYEVGALSPGAEAPMKSQIDACHHVAVVVRDAAAARAFYGDVLGLEELERPPELADAIPGAWYRIGASELHVFERRDFEPYAGPIGPHVALRAADFDGVVARLREHGCAFVFGPGRDSTGVARVILRDPTGNTVEITDAALHTQAAR